MSVNITPKDVARVAARLTGVVFPIEEKDHKVYDLEKNAKKAIRTFLKTLEPHGFFFNIQQGPQSRAGISDILGTYHGRFCALEIKSSKGIPSRIQIHFIEKVKAAGGIAGTAKSVADVKKLFNDFHGIK